ncbi:PhzF family phenazine biosynthesis protein [Povalibacter uvarum]|uniref:PhzF family phenazine biosynthesis protein n=1 Tax=Povalibacter uvarum TaxID=732238 RepID=A0A841HLK4_9GAMM|nr:PhzF family phenazine biosynthesis protein [Povalibacter uvarum]MBB6092865.1 PhzF family phenazine biosynthesis protein [Povalibacter uvarum]
MIVQRLAAFSNGNSGGNPAGVVIADTLPSVEEMQSIARDVGFSETAFAAPSGDHWRVRYFAPEAEVPFCGHATIALGAALAMREGDGTFPLQLNQGNISVEGRTQGDFYAAALQSPPTRSAIADDQTSAQALELFGLSKSDLDARIPVARIHGGADHLVIMLKDRATLAAMKYDFTKGQSLMQREGWVTVLLGYAESAQRFHTRNAFAFGGVYEDPATGASTAAFSGYLRDLGWPHGGRIEVHQGDDMGVPSRLTAQIGAKKGESIRVSGTARVIG